MSVCQLADQEVLQGLSIQQANAYSRTRMAGCPRQVVEQNSIMITTTTLQRLLKRRYEPLLSYYEKISPQLNEPLYTRPVRTVVREVHLIGKLSVRLPTRLGVRCLVAHLLFNSSNFITLL